MRICFRSCFILIFAVFYSCSLLFGAKANVSHIILLDNNARGLPVANTLMHVEALRVGNKVYLAWQGGPYLNPYAAYFDEETGQMSAVTEAGTNPLYAPPYKDNNHGEPAICMDTLGYIHVLYGSHSSRQLHSRSSHPYNITSFIQLPDISY